MDYKSSKDGKGPQLVCLWIFHLNLLKLPTRERSLFPHASPVFGEIVSAENARRSSLSPSSPSSPSSPASSHRSVLQNIYPALRARCFLQSETMVSNSAIHLFLLLRNPVASINVHKDGLSAIVRPLRAVPTGDIR